MTVRRFRERRNSMMVSWPGGWGWNDPAAIPPPGMMSMQRAGVPVTVHTALQVDVVHTALRVLGNGIINLGNLRAYRVGYDDQNLPYPLFLKPQPQLLSSTWGPMWQYDGMKRTVHSMALFGEAFWYVLARDYLDNASALEVLNPAFIDIKNPGDATSTSFGLADNAEVFYGSGVGRVQLDPSNLVHIPFMALPGARRGLNSIQYAGVNYALALAAMEYGQRWFAQGASPSFLLSTEQKLGQTEIKRIAQTFMVEHSGLQSAHLPLVLDSGMKASKISSTPDEAQFLGTLNYARSVLAGWFGLPQHLLGGNSDKPNLWGKTLEEQSYQMQDFTMSGYMVPIEEATGSLLPRGQLTMFNRTKFIRLNSADFAARLTAVRTTAAETVNEVRNRYLELPPTDGGDKIDQPLNSNQSPSAQGGGTGTGAAVALADKTDVDSGGDE